MLPNRRFRGYGSGYPFHAIGLHERSEKGLTGEVMLKLEAPRPGAFQDYRIFHDGDSDCWLIGVPVFRVGLGLPGIPGG